MTAPSPNEYSPAFAGYVAKAQAISDPIQALVTQQEDILAHLRPLTREQWLHRYAPGKWSLQQLLNHLTDTERIFAYRALRIARGDSTPLPGFDQDPYVEAAQADQCDPVSLVQEFEHVRKSTIFMCRNFPDSAWSQAGIVSGGPMTTRAMIYIVFGHAAHHLDILRERYHVG